MVYYTQNVTVSLSLTFHLQQLRSYRDETMAQSVSSNRLEEPGPKVIQLFPCSTQLSKKFILLINVKMPTIVGILTFISTINTTSERLKARNFFICRYFSFYKMQKFRAQ